MIRINLLSDKFEAPSKAALSQTTSMPALIPLPDEGEETPRKSKLPLLLALLVVVLAGGGGAYYYLSTQDAGDEEAEAPKAKPAPKPAPAPVADTTKKDSTKNVKKDTAKPEVAVAKPAPEAPKKVTAPKPEAPEFVGPSVHAPALSSSALAEVLAQAKPHVATEKPNRFDALSPSGRTAYQKFAFQRILSILRQVTPADGVGFSTVRIKSPGLLSIQGVTSKSDAFNTFQQGLTAQSLADLATASGKGNSFALVARLPFNPSFGGSAASGSDARKSLQQGLDLAASKGLTLKSAGEHVSTIGGAKRTSWVLKGQGGWDAVDAWLTGLQSMANPLGFTELSIAAGDKGKLQVTATVVCYGP